MSHPNSVTTITTHTLAESAHTHGTSPMKGRSGVDAVCAVAQSSKGSLLLLAHGVRAKGPGAQSGHRAQAEAVVALHEGWGVHSVKAHALHEPSTLVVVPLTGHKLPVGGPGPDRLGGVARAAHGIGVTEATQAVAGVHILCVGVVVWRFGVKGSPGEGAVLQDVDLVVRALRAAVSNLCRHSRGSGQKGNRATAGAGVVRQVC